MSDRTPESGTKLVLMNAISTYSTGIVVQADMVDFVLNGDLPAGLLGLSTPTAGHL